MKMMDRERVEGTQVTIGRRVNYRQGKATPSKKFAAEYTDHSGDQVSEHLGTQSKLEARRKAVAIQMRLDEGKPRIVESKISVNNLVESYFEAIQARGLAKKTQANTAPT